MRRPGIARGLAVLREQPRATAARLLVRLASGLIGIAVFASLLLPAQDDESTATHALHFADHLAMGDLGRSARSGAGVAGEALAALPASLALLALATALGAAAGVAIALPTGLGWRGRLPRLLAGAAGAIPAFALGPALMLTLWAGLGLLPDPTGAGPARAILPAITLAAPVALAVARPLAFSLAIVMRQSYFEIALASGLGRRAAILRHGLREALPGALAGLGMQFGLGLANLVVVERLFDWPGLGRYCARALAADDRPALVGACVAFATIYLLADVALAALRAVVDPRLRQP